MTLITTGEEVYLRRSQVMLMRPILRMMRWPASQMCLCLGVVMMSVSMVMRRLSLLGTMRMMMMAISVSMSMITITFAITNRPRYFP